MYKSMQRAVTWLNVHIGRRGAFMTFLAVLDALYAYSLSVDLPLRPPNYTWAIIWGIAALNAASGIFARNDRIQYGLAAGFKTSWALYQLELWWQGRAPLGWVSTVVWTGFAAAVLLISSWPEEPPLPADITDISQVLTPPGGFPLPGGRPPGTSEQEEGG